MQNKKFNWEGFIVECEYEVGRDAPSCSDPNNPAYYDSGDDWEFEVIDITTESGESIYSLAEIALKVDRKDADYREARRQFEDKIGEYFWGEIYKAEDDI